MATMGIRDVAYSRPHGQQRKTRFNLALFYWAIHLGCLARFSVPLRLEPHLREVLDPNTPRRFLVGVALPQSTEAWERLEQFLVRGKFERKYGFSAWKVLPIGDASAGDCWDKAAALTAAVFEGPTAREGISHTIIEQSLKLFEDVVQESMFSFFPTNSGQPLSLTEGFIYLDDAFGNFPAQNIPLAPVHLSILAALQSAREQKDPTLQLRSSGYESVVLSPETFLRFNDDVLQASLLRAARPAELDYSSDPRQSSLMKELLLKIFKRHAFPFGGAALEFALALATRRLKLRANDRNVVLEQSISHLGSEASALLGILLMADHGS